MNSNLKTEIKVKIHKAGRKSNWGKLEISPKFFETKAETLEKQDKIVINWLYPAAYCGEPINGVPRGVPLGAQRGV